MELSRTEAAVFGEPAERCCGPDRSGCVVHVDGVGKLLLLDARPALGSGVKRRTLAFAPVHDERVRRHVQNQPKRPCYNEQYRVVLDGVAGLRGPVKRCCTGSTSVRSSVHDLRPRRDWAAEDGLESANWREAGRARRSDVCCVEPLVRAGAAAALTSGQRTAASCRAASGRRRTGAGVAVAACAAVDGLVSSAHRRGGT